MLHRAPLRRFGAESADLRRAGGKKFDEKYYTAPQAWTADINLRPPRINSFNFGTEDLPAPRRRIISKKTARRRSENLQKI
jgi:hypothetical protein